MGIKSLECTSELDVGNVARIIIKSIVIVPPRNEIVTSGIIQITVEITEIGKLLEKNSYRCGGCSK